MEGAIRTYTFNNSRVSIYFGDIRNSNAEVVVSSDDSDLTMSDGVSKAILQKAGTSIRQQSSKIDNLRVGDVAVTHAGDMSQKYIFHAITIDHSDKDNSKLSKEINDDIQCYIVEHSIKRCFQIMRLLNISSIAFPCIGAGNANISYDKVAQAMSKAIADSLQSTNKSLSVEIYLYDSYTTMAPLDFLPFFECLASYAMVARRKQQHENDANIEWEDDMPQYKGRSLSDVAVDSLDTSNHKVFISYSRKDANRVAPICAMLAELNVKYWIDVDGTYSGESYKEVITKAIRRSDVVLFVSSANSNSSLNVTKEIAIADKYDKLVVPVILDDAPFHPRIEYDLSSIDTIDLRTMSERHVKKLKNVILARITTS